MPSSSMTFAATAGGRTSLTGAGVGLAATGSTFDGSGFAGSALGISILRVGSTTGFAAAAGALIGSIGLGGAAAAFAAAGAGFFKPDRVLESFFSISASMPALLGSAGFAAGFGIWIVGAEAA